jgi:hypothetical protein
MAGSLRLRFGEELHPVGDGGRAGPDPAAFGAPDPAILAGAHQAEARTGLAAEFEAPDEDTAFEQRREHAVAGCRVDGRAVETERRWPPGPGGDTAELGSRRLHVNLEFYFNAISLFEY